MLPSVFNTEDSGMTVKGISKDYVVDCAKVVGVAGLYPLLVKEEVAV